MSLNLGVVLPTVELGPGPEFIREYAQTAQDLGYTHLVIQDHVLGADPTVHQGWNRPYTNKTLTPDPFIQAAFLATAVPGMELMTGVVVLSQRQTALVAKQAAEVDILTGGNFRLGVGIGWNPVEYQALGADFHTRGARSEEQVELMRALWTQPSVSFKGKWRHIDAAGINPYLYNVPSPFGSVACPMHCFDARPAWGTAGSRCRKCRQGREPGDAQSALWLRRRAWQRPRYRRV